MKVKATGSDLAVYIRDNLAAAASITVALLLVITGSANITSLGSVISNARAVAWLMVLLIVALAQGSLFMKILGSRANNYELRLHVVLAAGTGLWFIAMESFFLGLAGFFSTRALTGLVLGTGFFSLLILRLMGHKLAWPVSTSPRKNSVPVVLLWMTLALSAVFVLVPPIFFDAMTYHLELPSRYLLEGRVFHVPENLYSGYPQVTEMLYGTGLAIGGVSLGGLLSLTTFALVMLLMMTWGRVRYGKEEAAWGTLFLALTPPFLITVGFFYNDWLMTFFTIGALMLLLGGNRDARRMVVAGALAGMAAGCKYTALAFAAGIPFVAGLYDDWTTRKEIDIRAWSVFWLSFLICALPWYLKNYIFTGDPLYPLLTGLLTGEKSVVVLAADTHFSLPKLSDLWNWLIIPYDLVFRPAKFQMPLSIGMVPLILLPTLFALRGKRPGGRFIGIWMILSLVTWYLTFRAARFALPMLVIIFLWFGVSFVQTANRPGWTGSLLKGVVLLFLFSNVGTFLGFQSWFAGNVEAAFHMVPHEQYLVEKYTPYEAIKYLNILDPQPEKVLFVGEMKGFYSQFPREVPTFDMPNRLLEQIKEGTGNQEIADSLLEASFSHILFNPVEMKRLGVKSPYLRMTTGEEKMLKGFFISNTHTLLESRGIFVMEIIP